jgi:type IV pilus assembly protein PilB
MPDAQPTVQPVVPVTPQVPTAGITPPQPETTSVLDVLFTEHQITKEQYDEVKVRSASDGVTPEQYLAANNIVSEIKLTEAKAKVLGVPFISLQNTSFSPDALKFLSEAVVERFQIIPFFYDDSTKTLSVAMINPIDFDAVAFIRQKTGLNIKTFAATPSEVRQAITQQYRTQLVGDVDAAVKESEEYRPKSTVDRQQLAEMIKEAPIARIVSTILEYAVTSRASDVHIEPLEDRVRVRYRIDGILYDKLSLPRNVQSALVSRIKILSALKIDEHRTPQDGRFNFKVEDQEVDLRISVIPTVTGEKIVMRLLRKSGGIPTLNDLGLTGTALKNLETAILKPHGIILVCGPTGSGKTTTLYAVLSRLNTTRVNIMSLEDPVEYQIQGVSQVQINPAVGLTFASGLRSFLRQDPNIILVGEIRDKETTDLAVQAALTGHLVFSTLHTQNAAGALPRLIDLGAERFLLVSTINALVGQRIVRKICSACKEAYVLPPQLLEQMKVILGKLYTYNDSEVKLYKGKGCSECGSSGYSGRIGIFEVMPVTEKLSRIVLEKPDSITLENEAIAEGMITMKQDGYLKVLQGLTTIEEVLRVAQE